MAIEDTPAFKAGIKPNDLIVKLDESGVPDSGFGAQGAALDSTVESYTSIGVTSTGAIL